MKPKAEKQTCPECNGTRLVQYKPPYETNFHAMGRIEDCPVCHGTGYIKPKKDKNNDNGRNL